MKLYRLIVTASFVLSAFFLVKCNSEAGNTLPANSGAAGEVLVIMPNNQWEGNDGKYLRNVFDQLVPHLPQAEPMFTLLHFSPQEFSKILKTHRNIIIVDVSGSKKNITPHINVQHDKWARDQLIYKIGAKDSTDLKAVIEKNSSRMINILDQAELSRWQSFYSRFDNPKVEDSVKKVLNIGITVARESRVAKVGDHFMWIRRDRMKYKGNEAHDLDEGIILFTYPYTSDSTFTNNHILAVRDSVLKKYIPGPVDSSYMTTEFLFPPTSKEINYNDQYAVETRGLWKVQNFFMGGPFIALTIYDKAHNRIVYAEGYVYAPNFDKREYLREVEAMIYSVKLSPEQKAS